MRQTRVRSCSMGYAILRKLIWPPTLKRPLSKDSSLKPFKTFHRQQHPGVDRISSSAIKQHVCLHLGHQLPVCKLSCSVLDQNLLPELFGHAALPQKHSLTSGAEVEASSVSLFSRLSISCHCQTRPGRHTCQKSLHAASTRTHKFKARTSSS